MMVLNSAIAESEEVLATQASIEKQVRELVWLKSQKAAITELITQTENAIGEAMAGKRLELPGLGVIERNKRSARKAWNHADLQQAIRQVAMDNRLADPETGELETAAEAEARLLKETANPSWRTTALKEIGIDPDEYCETTFSPGWALRTDGITGAVEVAE